MGDPDDIKRLIRGLIPRVRYFETHADLSGIMLGDFEFMLIPPLDHYPFLIINLRAYGENYVEEVTALPVSATKVDQRRYLKTFMDAFYPVGLRGDLHQSVSKFKELAKNLPRPNWSKHSVSETVTHSPEEIKKEAAKAETPKSDEHAEAGNYAKGHVKIQGLSITIENAKGSTRSGTDDDGKPWSVTLPAHYGYVARVGAVTFEKFVEWLKSRKTKTEFERLAESVTRILLSQ